jgi:uncharacterized damage-inducible protein DinB
MPGSMVNALRTVVVRELRGLDREIAAYPDDESLWAAPAGARNSAGNLVLHLAGNLRHFIGAALGGTNYKRDRDAEFATKGLSRDELRSVVADTIEELSAAFDTMSDEDLSREYPLTVAENQFRTGDFLVHLAVHLSYHLGQIDYHRRLLTSSANPVDTVSPRELTSTSRS